MHHILLLLKHSHPPPSIPTPCPSLSPPYFSHLVFFFFCIKNSLLNLYFNIPPSTKESCQKEVPPTSFTLLNMESKTSFLKTNALCFLGTNIPFTSLTFYFLLVLGFHPLTHAPKFYTTNLFC